jgi:hypothetical protein
VIDIVVSTPHIRTSICRLIQLLLCIVVKLLRQRGPIGTLQAHDRVQVQTEKLVHFAYTLPAVYRISAIYSIRCKLGAEEHRQGSHGQPCSNDQAQQLLLPRTSRGLFLR